jgi:hypothetical protein
MPLAAHPPGFVSTLPSREGAAPARRPLFLRIVDAIGDSNRRKADRETARFIARNGGFLTDAVERRIGAYHGGRF